MSQEVIVTPQPLDLRSLGKVWLATLVRPSLSSYAALGRQPLFGSWRAYLWIFAGALISGAINALSPFVGQASDQRYVDLLLLALIPVSALIAVGALAAFTWCAQGIARLFKGTGTHQQLAHVFAAFSAPLLIVASILDLIPPARVLLIVLYIYWMVLYVMAVRAVNSISRVRAVIAVLGALLLLGLVWLGIAFMVGYSGLLLP